VSAAFLFFILMFITGVAEAVCTSSTVGSDTVVVCTSNDTITIPAGVSSVRYLLVAGGGGGGGIGAGNQDGTGGGGAGGVLSGSGFAVTPGVYNVVVGAGGTAGTGATNGGNGANSTFSTLTAIGGGGGAREGNHDGLDGGSGGGGGDKNSGGSGIAGQGNDGGDGDKDDGGGGGGGAGGAGEKGKKNNGGDGGPGIANNITGASLMYSGGGGGGADDDKPGGAGGTGGGASAPNGRGPGVAGTANTGGGGSGATGSKAGGGAAFGGGAGGSGIVIIRYTVGGAGGCTTSTIGADTLVVCTSNDTITIPAGVSSVRYLVVAGGAGGGGINAGKQDGAGGGGAGGVLSGVGFAVTPGVFNIVVGTGGSAGSGAVDGGNGSNSTFSTLTAIGGGGGAREGNHDGLDGGSGGGASGKNNGGSGTAGQGNDGGDGDDKDGGGGGGGAGGVGQDGEKNRGGDGGPGIADNITGVSLMYGGGGGGGADDDRPGGAGGAGGGASAPTGRGPGVAGTANTGGGGSGATGSNDGGGVAFTGGDGGSGVVIIRYTVGGLVAEYRLDEASWAAPGDVLDSSGNALHGQAVGGAVPVPGRVCNGAQFNMPPAPLTDYIQVADDPLLDITTALTVTSWVRPSAYPGGGGLMTVLSKDTNYEYHITPTGQVNWWWNTGAGQLFTGAGTVPLNAWTHIAITFRQGQQIIYVNGVAGANGTDGAALFTNNLPLQIGDDQGFGGGSRRFRGLIDEVQVHNVTMSAAEVVTVMNATRPCASTVDHYFVQNAASGVNCQAESVTVTAHDPAHSSTSAAGRVITITAARIAGAPGTRGDYAVTTGTGTFANGTVDDGIATYTFGVGETSAVFSYKNTWVQTVNFAVTDGTATDTSGTASADAGYNQDLDFVPSGFRFVDGSNSFIPNQSAGVSSAPFYLQAIQTGAGGCGGFGPCTGVCTVPSAFGNGASVSVDLAFRCDNPTTCQPGQQVSITNNGTSAIAANPAIGVTAWTSKTLVFGPNGMAAFNMVYPDVGAISLHAQYDIPLGDGSASGNLMTGSSNSFVVSPFGFVVETAAPNEIKRTADGFLNPAAATAVDPMFVRAGDDFSVTATAVNFGGAATPNFGKETSPETVLLTANLAGGLGLVNNPALTNPSAFGVFNGGRATGTTFSWDEVGIITLTPSVGDASYLGAGDVTGTTSGNVGRFVPFDFSVTRNVPLFDSGCSAVGKDAFTYIGEPFVYQTPPVITVTARNKAAGTTLNYSGDFFKITSASLSGKAYTAATGTLNTLGAPAVDPAIRYNGDLIVFPPPPAAGTGELTFSAGTGLLFTRVNPVAAFDADISLAINVVDLDTTLVAMIDGVAGVNPVRFGQATPGNGVLFAGTVVTFGKTPREMRFGRLRPDNVSGTTRLGLPLRIQAQYYAPFGFVTNGDDNCTSFSGMDIAMSFVGGTNLAACDTAVVPSGAVTLVDGLASGLQLAAPGIGNDGSADLTFNLGAASGNTCTAVGGPTSPATSASLDYLQGNWGGAAAWDQDAGARATFGIYDAAAEFLYLQENY